LVVRGEVVEEGERVDRAMVGGAASVVGGRFEGRCRSLEVAEIRVRVELVDLVLDASDSGGRIAVGLLED
jgi:hypothetical protein